MDDYSHFKKHIDFYSLYDFPCDPSPDFNISSEVHGNIKSDRNDNKNFPFQQYQNQNNIFSDEAGEEIVTRNTLAFIPGLSTQVNTYQGQSQDNNTVFSDDVGEEIGTR